jgi:hypothetical protein
MTGRPLLAAVRATFALVLGSLSAVFCQLGRVGGQVGSEHFQKLTHQPSVFGNRIGVSISDGGLESVGRREDCVHPIGPRGRAAPVAPVVAEVSAVVD